VAVDSSEPIQVATPGRSPDAPWRGFSGLPLGLAAAVLVESTWLLFLGWMAVWGG